jgi:predicted site-specific integrase-resolvase
MTLVKIGKAAEMLGVDVQTLRNWERSGELMPDRKSAGGVRYYDVAKVLGLGNEDAPTIGYARVSSHDQKNDLVRQAELLEAFCAAKGWRFEIIQDLGSGMNYRKKGLNTLLEMILRKKIRRLVLTHKDRLLRFGSELIFALCELQNIEIVIINKGEQPTFEEELAKDVIEIITVFSARLYGSRSGKTKRLLDAMNAEDPDGEEVVIRKSALPHDLPPGPDRDMLETMNLLLTRAILFYGHVMRGKGSDNAARA